MTGPNQPGPDVPPEHVLEELLEAFSEESAPQYNFDDPSIDRILGITDEHESPETTEPAAADSSELLEPVDPIESVEPVKPVTVPKPGKAPKPAKNQRAAKNPPPQVGQGAADPRRIIVIAEDDRPDSVYLDEDKERAFHERRDAVDHSSERSTIFIADLDGAISTEAPPTGSRGGVIDPRIRARRISVRRAEGRRRLIWVGIGAGVLIVAIAAVAVFASSIFDVRDVSVQGAVYTDPEVLQSVIDDLQGEPVLLVDTTAAQKRLESVPWVESARVSTKFPHSVFIDIRERVPIVAFRGGDGEYRVIDVQGRVLDVITGQPTDYLLVAGDNPDTARGQFAGAPYASVADLVSSLPPEIRDVTLSVGVDAGTGTLTMVLANDQPEGVDVRLGNAQAIDEKLARLLRQVRSGLDGYCSIDVSTSDAGVVPC
ncbi:MAG TPA: FtsQ-type POTRA domain-containing protein [Ilumatobacteraceae bacterium]|nr:FtsQ-type POTRA domain-containing protein [Ilumatobacteraceae bacterium]